MNIWCIHGAMQTPSVWDSFGKNLATKNPNLELVSEDLSDGDFKGFEHWTDDFSKRVQEQGAGEKSFLLGYSLGGRLALHACLERPDLWLGLVVVGADPGNGSKEEMLRKLEIDQEWAAKLRNEPLEKLIKEWDDQKIFCGIQNPAPRKIEDLNSSKISHQFKVFSKGRQRNLVPELSQIKNPPILYLSGEEDEKYSTIGKELASFCQSVEFRVIPDAGHRVPWENPSEFYLAVSDFVKQCMQ